MSKICTFYDLSIYFATKAEKTFFFHLFLNFLFIRLPYSRKKPDCSALKMFKKKKNFLKFLSNSLI